MLEAGSPAPTDAPPSDAELRARLEEADRHEDLLTRAQAAEIGPGPCPVCAEFPPPEPEPEPAEDGAPVEGETQRALAATVAALPPVSGLRPVSPGWQTPFLARSALTCDACRVDVPPKLNHAAWLLVTLSALVLAFGAVFLIFQSQRLEETFPRMLAFGGGALLLAITLSLGYVLHSTGSLSLVAKELVRARRRARGDKTILAPADWAGETLEAIVISIILALLIRHVAIEAFVIPTGSMAPTLLGDHYEADCLSCGFPLEIGRDNNAYETELKLGARCQQCEQLQTYEFGPRDLTGGDKILVNKLCYTLRDPERYEVAVFVYPRQPWEHYIKRVVGLPGETIKLKNGDVFVNGKRARKPDRIQDALWLPVFDSRYARRSRETGPLWVTVPEPGREPDAWDLTDENRPRATARGERPPSWLRFERNRRGVLDPTPYSKTSSGTHAVSDLRLAATVRAQGTARLGIEEDARGVERIVAGSFPVGPGLQTYSVDVNDVPVAQVQAPGLTPGAPHRIVFAYADDRARLLVDGRLILAWEDAFAPGTTDAAFPLLQADGPLEVDALEIGRDIYYTQLGARYDAHEGDGVEVPEGMFYMLGDNSPNSEDSRKWGFVDREHLVGRAFGVFWPVIPSRVKVIR